MYNLLPLKMEPLNRKRGAIKGKLTRLNGEIDRIEDNQDPEIFEEYLGIVDTAFDDFVLIKESITAAVDELEAGGTKTAAEIEALFADQEIALGEIESGFALIRAQLKLKIKTLRASENPLPPPINPNIPNNPDHSVSIKLPQMKLPSFSGKYEEYSSFKEKFIALVHNNKQVQTIQKFQLLLDCLSENVRKGFNHLEFVEANYTVVLDKLEKRYSNKKLTVDRHLSGLVGLKHMSKESSSELQRIIDETSIHVSALNSLGVETESWDVMIVYLVSIKLDPETRKKWEESVDKDILPEWSVMQSVLQKRCNSLASVETAVDFKKKPSSQKDIKDVKPVRSNVVSEDHSACIKCGESHSLADCREFVGLALNKKFEFAKSKRVCFNCLSQDHVSGSCKKDSLCTKCPKTISRKHSVLLHVGSKAEKSQDNKDKSESTKEDTEKPKQEESKEKVTVTLNCQLGERKSRQVVLMTALVYVFGRNDQPQLGRALLDSGSEASFMTAEFATKLKLPIEMCEKPVIGIQGAKSMSCGKTTAYVRSRQQDFGKTLPFLVVNQVTKKIPCQTFSTQNWNIPSFVSLADPEFNKAGPIDILIGAELFLELLKKGCMRIRDDLPYLQETVLGWVWSGTYTEPKDAEDSGYICNLVVEDELDGQLEKFWAIENPMIEGEKTLEEHLCEEKFKKEVTRNEDGHYEVSLMLNDKFPLIGDTREIAAARLRSLWKKFESDPELKQMYFEFIAEYLRLGHMREMENDSPGKYGAFYLPHHGVLKPENTSTRLRVVFNASQKSSTGVSLNDALMNGGMIQASLHTILLNHRLFRFAFGVDVVKMYRQFKLKPEYTGFLRILWQWMKNGPVKVLELLTVTYGLKDAAFVATRTLYQIALDFQKKYPLAAQVIIKSFYIDNGLYGSNSIEEATEMVKQLVALTREVHLELHKWCANEPGMLTGIPSEQQEAMSIDESEGECGIKTLGMLWYPKNDVYRFVVSLGPIETAVTKRIVLSELARIFDPLGLLNPVTVRIKIFLQKLWALKYDWDQELSDELSKNWMELRKDLLLAAELEVPRFINPRLSVRFELFGYCDASSEAYGTCIYVVCLFDDESSTSHLIYSKSRVAPVSPTTIPRLELEAALLLAEGVSFVVNSVEMKFESVRLFSDSKVALAWIHTDILKLHIYVANRVRNIKKFAKDFEWKYVPTKSNPADIVSRGMSAKKLKNSNLWWNGKIEDTTEKDPVEFDIEDVLGSEAYKREMKKSETEVSSLLATSNDNSNFSAFQRISSYPMLRRVMVYALRFIHNCRANGKASGTKRVGRITTEELSRADEKIVRLIQVDAFGEELKQLERNGTLPNNHALKSLNLFLLNGVIRVGGRISNSAYKLDKRHQMLLPKHHRFTEMLINALHLRHLHIGAQGLHALIRGRYWIVNGKNFIRQTLHKCIVCFKVNPKFLESFMGDLPNYRVEPAFPFQNTGVDYGGPIMIKMGGPRSKIMVKSWFSLFVCMTTKAVHLELVTSLSSASFKAALQRFISRRGRPKNMYSDNGTNFIGCRRELQELQELFNKENQSQIADYCLERGINWSTIPPRASHFGGQWEAGVKSVKYHFKRIAGNANLTYEEMLTLLIEIEGILNSRPLYALSNDPNDYNPITPAHFLIGRAIVGLPELDFSETADNRLTRYERITKLRQHFWKRFTQEYVTSLQQRAKWFKGKPEVKIGQLVLLKDENLPSYKWRLGRISKTYPGKDQVVRVVAVKLPEGQEMKRDTKKISILPLETEVYELSGAVVPPGGVC